MMIVLLFLSDASNGNGVFSVQCGDFSGSGMFPPGMGLLIRIWFAVGFCVCRI